MSSSKLFDRICQSQGLPPATLELRFHPKRKWRFDLAWPEVMLACEIEGGAWTYGRHNRPAGFMQDLVKYGTAQALGWTIVRVNHELIKSGHALKWVESVYRMKCGGAPLDSEELSAGLP